ncbi:MAG: ATP-binding cassette domain-containing protein [Bacteroidales bacterium]
MNTFACSLGIDVVGQTINMDIENSQLWCMEFDSSTTMAIFLKKIKDFIHPSTTTTGNIHWKSFSQQGSIQIVPYGITRQEEKIFYYQQRYHATENDEVLRVKDFIGKDNSVVQQILKQTMLYSRIEEPITQLSTGEFKIACLLKAFRPETKIIFIEELFSGLDEANRSGVIKFLHELKQALEVCIIVVTTRPYERAYFDQYTKIHSQPPQPQNLNHSESLKFLLRVPHRQNFQHAFKLSKVVVRYNDRVILKDISWAVNKGEKWALHGKNGSGKSTLLSLINADHPQSYANDILLFDQPRKYGTSIWEIKDNIGFFSHEFFRFFDKTRSISDTILSILNSNPYRRSKNQHEILEKLGLLMQYFEISHDTNRPLYQLTPYQQRLIVLLGILLKEAPLLILDEPYHYFDMTGIAKFNFILDNFLSNTTLIFVSHDEKDFPACIQHHFYLS